MAQNKSPLLELSTDIERDFIKIDGGDYPIKGYSELSIVDFHWLKNRYLKVHALFTKEELAEDEVDGMQQTIEDFVDFIFTDPPKKLLDKLTHGHKYQIMMAFTELFLENMPEGAKQSAQAKIQEKAAPEQKPKNEQSLEQKKAESSGAH